MKTRFLTLTNPKGFLETSGWQWRQPGHAPSGWKSDMWIGTDSEGEEWLVKMRGRAAAAREHLFATLAEHLGICCQRSYFLRLDVDSEPMRALPSADPFQLAIRFEQEHSASYCSSQCPLAKLDQTWKDTRLDKIETLRNSGLLGALNIVRGTLLGLLCGQREPPGTLWTVDHNLILIDHETMWTRKPRDPFHSFWVRTTASGGSLARHLCRRVANLDAPTMERLAAVPEPFSEDLDCAQALQTAQSEARRFLAGQKNKPDGGIASQDLTTDSLGFLC